MKPSDDCWRKQDVTTNTFPKVLLSTHKVFFHTSYMYGAQCPLTKQRYLGFRLVFNNPKKWNIRLDYEWLYLEVTDEEYCDLVLGSHASSVDAHPHFDAVAYLRQHLFDPSREDVLVYIKRKDLNLALATAHKLNIRVHDQYNVAARWRGAQEFNTTLHDDQIWYRAIGVLKIPIKCLYKSLHYVSYKGFDIIPFMQHCE
jgi:hypothetical protein